MTQTIWTVTWGNGLLPSSMRHDYESSDQNSAIEKFATVICNMKNRTDILVAWANLARSDEPKATMGWTKE